MLVFVKFFSLVEKKKIKSLNEGHEKKRTKTPTTLSV
jgi:hypothetical protein